MYNLPPQMCMTRLYMSLSAVILGPHNLKTKIDVYLQTLIDELKTFWNKGVDTYVHTNQTFKMNAAIMWTVNDFPTYEMLSSLLRSTTRHLPTVQKKNVLV